MQRVDYGLKRVLIHIITSEPLEELQSIHYMARHVYTKNI